MNKLSSNLNLIVISCLAMVLARMLYAENINLIFLIWNLFLAWIPFYTSTKLLDMNSQSKFKFYTILTICILFLPNAIYLVTDLIHLKPRLGVPFWYDVVILFSFSVMGLCYSTITLINLENIFRRYFTANSTILIMIILFLVSGYGVYLGRVLRWNSWDALIHPFQILIDTFHFLIHPFHNKMAWLMTLLFGGIQGIFWSMFRSISFSKTNNV